MPSKRKTPLKAEPEIETERVSGVEIKVTKSDDRERLFIGGKPIAFKKLPNGYLLEANFYVEPSTSLMSAAKAFVAQERGSKRKLTDA